MIPLPPRARAAPARVPAGGRAAVVASALAACSAPSPATGRQRPAPLALALAVAVLALAAGAQPAGAGEFRFELTERAADARYWVWVVTDLDLTRDDQPAARVELPPGQDVVAVSVEGIAADTWLFLHERVQPVGGPPLDLLLPVNLLPFRGGVFPDAPIRMRSVDPQLLLQRERLSLRPSVLGKVVLAALLLFGGGFWLRRALRAFAERPGRRCAPLPDAVAAAPSSRGERRALAALVGLTVAARLPGISSASLDLLEVSYLPGIGRPAPFADGAGGLAAVGAMLRELAALYCLDLTHPPLHHAVLGVMGLLGRAEWLLRLPALATSAASALLLFALFRRFSARAGLLAVALHALAAPALYFGQDATPYAFVGTVALGALHLALRALETGSARAWLALFGLLVAGFLAHYNVAPFGLALVGMLCLWAVRGRRDPRWPAAMRLALGQGLKLAALPLAWAWLHWSTFPTVAQDTRLVADTYMPDPGPASFLLDFVKVTAGIRADAPTWGLIGALPLLVLALALRRGEARPDRQLLTEGLAAFAATFVLSTLFFYDNARVHLGGRVFYGFRWVGWFHPVLLGALALGIAHGRAPVLVRGALAALWLAAASIGTARFYAEPTRADYERATATILAELQDGDGIASLPPWFQRGNLAYYLFQTGRLRRHPDDGESAFRIDGKRLTLEPVLAAAPFETTARSAHVERLWVAVVDERMFGREKFSGAVAAQAVAWADEALVPDGVWSFPRLTLRRYRRPAGALDLAPGETLQIASSDVLLMARTYPVLRPPLRLRPAAEVPDRQALRAAAGAQRGGLGLGRALRYHAPMSPPCVDEEYVRSTEHFRVEGGNRWFLDLRLPIAAGREPPTVRLVGAGQLRTQEEPGGLRVQGVGGPCDGPPLVVEVEGT